ncbi:Bug family tripartite tricarboxylate transporter substrate binding protein [Allopusillimonas ginsengisoli]|uniref:Bug family tripartite tricarboxylate transporter substrate binding protein n=1 Tax=Allopusillimonas ginsengisoli TaxID=453575 RepID=UPI0010210C4A|nr:tripartite tricarboxylate transporter substrate binding protein [Allopusillimonas ginsengisoli]TEA77154.1 tripartite tricarboxylate transporter substrate binding protein [Allopusillimonas ginsengisoli]
MRILSFTSRLAAAVTLGIATFSSAMAASSDYPSRPIQLIVPFSAGGQFDFLARVVAESMSKNLGRQMIVENISGAGGNVGGAKAANAKPDGYTLLEYGGNYAIAKYLTKNLSYDPLGDFKPVAAISLAPHAILINAKLPINSFEELVAYAKAHPDAFNYATPGVGTSMQLTFEEIKSHFGFPATHIPYRGGSNALNDLASGQVSAGIVAVAPAMPFIQSGQIKALAITGPERVQPLPDVPTISELGYTGFSSGSWAGIAVPKGTPDEIVERLHASVQAALSDPDLLARFDALAFTALPGTQADFQARIDDEAQRYGPIIERLQLQR